MDAALVRSWLPVWRKTVESLGSMAPARLCSARIPYYFKAFDAILDSDQPLAALWPLLRTWTDAIILLPVNSPAYESWQTANTRLGLLGEPFTQKIAALDAYLDQVEELLDDWAKENGE